MSRLPFYLIVGLLMVLGIGMSVHRHIQMEVPWTPGEQRQVWEVEAIVDFTAVGEPVRAELALPSHQRGYRILTENTASPGYGLSFLQDETGRRAQWSIRQATGSQQLYYSVRLQVTEDHRQ